MEVEQSVPKRRHIKFRHRGITRKKTYNIQNTVKVRNRTKVVALISLRTFLIVHPIFWAAEATLGRLPRCHFHSGNEV